MELKGKLIKKISEAGTSKAGKPWESITCIIQTEQEYNNITAVKFMGDKAKTLDDFKEGDTVIASCNVYSREYNGRFYNNIDGWRISLNNSKDTFITSDDDDEMPF